MRFLLMALLAGGMILATGVDPAESAAPLVPASDSQKLVFLGDAGPLLLEMRMRIDGRSYRTAYQALMTQLFRSLDRDGDGVLSPAEAAQAPPAAALTGPGFFNNASMKLSDKKGTPLKQDAVVEAYSRAGLTSFALGSSSRGGVVFLNLDGSLQGDRASGEALTSRLFALLDADMDGKLSKKELLAAPAMLAKLDVDDDEVVTRDELLGPPSNAGNGQIAFTTRMVGATTPQVFHIVPDQPSNPQLGKTLLSRYGANKARKLTPSQFRVSRENFTRLDTNGDGSLDEAELARFGTLPPEVIVGLELGTRTSGKPVLTVIQGQRARVNGNNVTLDLDQVEIRITGPRGPEGPQIKIDFDQQYTAQFRTADKDMNGYLDRMEAKSSPFFSSLFTAMDADGDGQLFEKEMFGYLKKLEKLRQQASRSCITMTVKEDSQGLYGRIDTDGDGRLGVRELRQAVGLLARLDRNRDGFLVATEIPRRYTSSFDLGPSPAGETNVFAIATVMGNAPATPAMKKGPVWFRKMDFNRDGDVSRREWLGPEEEFGKADTDRDGLISLAEAEGYDALQRKK